MLEIVVTASVAVPATAMRAAAVDGLIDSAKESFLTGVWP